jgi:hypothetical protein
MRRLPTLLTFLLSASCALAQGSLLGIPSEMIQPAAPSGIVPPPPLPPQVQPQAPAPGVPVPRAPGIPPVMQVPAPPSKGAPQAPVGYGLVQVRTVLNVRGSPWGPILGTLKPNTLVKIIGRRGDWYEIEWNGRRAFVHSEYIFTTTNNPFSGGGPAAASIANPQGATVRATPWGNVVGNLPPGAGVQILGRTNNWWQVQAGGTVGYVPVTALDPRARMPGVPTPPYGAPGSRGGYAPGGITYGLPQAGGGQGARAARGPDRHANYGTVRLERFPVPHATRFSDDWGIGTHAPGGSSVFNMGIDIFAPEGAPIVAPITGRVTQVGSNGKGGLTVHMVGPDGTNYYFAHLAAHQPGIRPGMTIPAGTVIGYVGRTGNAANTPPHLHFAAVRNGQAIPAYRGLCEAGH